jgi:hypothetical protein
MKISSREVRFPLLPATSFNFCNRVHSLVARDYDCPRPRRDALMGHTLDILVG